MSTEVIEYSYKHTPEELEKAEALVEKYKIFRELERVGTELCETGKILIPNETHPTEEAMTEIRESKSAIMDFLAGREFKRQQERLRRERNFEAVPGVKELRQARREWSKYHRDFERCFYNDEDFSDLGPKPQSDEASLEKQFPSACFALEVDGKRFAANYEISAIAEKAYNALCEGGNWKDVKKVYDADMSEFCQRHLWD